VDFANLPFGYCVVTALGRFDHWRGHLVLDEYKLILEFPHGMMILIQSGIVTHGNVEVGEGERRYSFTKFAAGGLFRWVDNGFQMLGELEKRLSGEERKEKARADGERWEMGLRLVPKLYEYADV
jgi:hypothetical protein